MVWKKGFAVYTFVFGSFIPRLRFFDAIGGVLVQLSIVVRLCTYSTLTLRFGASFSRVILSSDSLLRILFMSICCWSDKGGSQSRDFCRYKIKRAGF